MTTLLSRTCENMRTVLFPSRFAPRNLLRQALRSRLREHSLLPKCRHCWSDLTTGRAVAVTSCYAGHVRFDPAPCVLRSLHHRPNTGGSVQRYRGASRSGSLCLRAKYAAPLPFVAHHPCAAAATMTVHSCNRNQSPSHTRWCLVVPVTLSSFAAFSGRISGSMRIGIHENAPLQRRGLAPLPKS